MEQTVKKREWVKNAAIIFLAVMLVLTFFSNTILNRTLPEVVTRYVEPGAIDSKVRISGKVSARENYDVIIDQTRKVASVNVKVGQEVSTGDLLFTLEAGDSDELDAARKELESLQLEYQRALLNATGGDYSRENRAIVLAQEALDKAIAKRDGLVVAPEALAAAEEVIRQAEEALAAAKQVVKDYSQQIKDAQYGREHSVTDEMRSRLAEAQTALAAAEADLRAARLVYGVNDPNGDYYAAKRIAMNCIIDARRALSAGAAPLSDAEKTNILAYMDQELPSDRKLIPSDREKAVIDLLPYYMERIASVNGGGASSALLDELAAAEKAMETAESDLQAARLVYGVNDPNGAYFAVKRIALNWVVNSLRSQTVGKTPLSDAEKASILAYMDQELSSDRKITPSDREKAYIELLPYYMEMLYARTGEDAVYSDAQNKAYAEVSRVKAAYAAAAERLESATKAVEEAGIVVIDEPLSATFSDAQKRAYTEVSKVKTAYSAAAAALAAAQDAIRTSGSETGDYNGKTHAEYERELLRLEPLLEAAQEQQAAAEDALTLAKTEKQKLVDRQSSWEAACSEVDSAQRSLEDLYFSLSEQKKSDGRQQALEALSRQELQGRIAEAEQRIESLSGSAVTEVKARVNGTVASLAVSAGHKAEKDKALATIEVKDLGYTMTATVSVDQAKLLHIGDTANVSNYYWGSRTTAVLSGMQPDPKDPRTSRILTFDLAGDISSGDSISFSIGERNASYDLVVPNSAVRSDTNGSFVLMITAKNSPLGNRYFATRVDVEVVASDETNTAIKGALSNMDSVITTSSGNAPVKNGDQVRLADMN